MWKNSITFDSMFLGNIASYVYPCSFKMTYRVHFFNFIFSLAIHFCACPGTNPGKKANALEHVYITLRTYVSKEKTLVELGRDLYRAKKYDEALRCLTKAIEYHNTESKYYRIRGNIHKSMGNLDDAILDLRKAVQYDEYTIDYQMLLCDALFEAGKYSEAVYESVNLDPSIIAHLGDRLCSIDKFEEAIDAYSEAIEKFPSPEYFRSRGNCYTMKGDLDLALSDFKEAVTQEWQISRSKKEGHEHVLLSLALYDAGKVDDAKSIYHSMSDVQLMTLGDELAAREMPDEALTCYSEAINRYPENAECYKKRAHHFRRNEKLKEAIVDLEEVIRIDPSCVQCRIELSEVFLEMGKDADANRILDNLNRTNFPDMTAEENVKISLLKLIPGKTKDRRLLKKLSMSSLEKKS